MRISFLALIALVFFALSGCSPEYTETTSQYTVMPEELKDCRIYRISKGTDLLTVIRCPNSSTTTSYMSGKTRKTTSLVEKDIE